MSIRAGVFLVLTSIGEYRGGVLPVLTYTVCDSHLVVSLAPRDFTPVKLKHSKKNNKRLIYCHC